MWKYLSATIRFESAKEARFERVEDEKIPTEKINTYIWNKKEKVYEKENFYFNLIFLKKYMIFVEIKNEAKFSIFM